MKWSSTYIAEPTAAYNVDIKLVSVMIRQPRRLNNSNNCHAEQRCAMEHNLRVF